MFLEACAANARISRGSMMRKDWAAWLEESLRISLSSNENRSPGRPEDMELPLSGRIRPAEKNRGERHLVSLVNQFIGCLPSLPDVLFARPRISCHEPRNGGSVGGATPESMEAIQEHRMLRSPGRSEKSGGWAMQCDKHLPLESTTGSDSTSARKVSPGRCELCDDSG